MDVLDFRSDHKWIVLFMLTHKYLSNVIVRAIPSQGSDRELQGYLLNVIYKVLPSSRSVYQGPCITVLLFSGKPDIQGCSYPGFPVPQQPLSPFARMVAPLECVLELILVLDTV